MIATSSPTIDSLLRTVIECPGEATPMLVLADALDEAGACGDAMRWCVENDREPRLNEGSYHPREYIWYPEGFDRRFRHWIPPCFRPFTKGRSHFLGTHAECWIWLIACFGELRSEGKI